MYREGAQAYPGEWFDQHNALRMISKLKSTLEGRRPA